ncbi:hypothetical protein qu_702 [Acanthamoeba polyphaga mimivirus]|nr:hypothetical protein [Mimivirus reunion]WMV62036.1 hypothetical protein qu_702 [Mimivirus sp.]WMV63013.1 hypothetical protein qu_702 [Acanthamoeba polyphaga mimivirus]WMV63990.1 hypothetical protein qu_702 [Mimivirus sp.]
MAQIILDDKLEKLNVNPVFVDLKNQQDKSIIVQNYENHQTIKRTVPNALIDMIKFAWANHLPVSLRPDDFWIQILTQFATHVNLNSELYQKYFSNKDNPDSETQISIGYTDFDNVQDVPIDDFVQKILSKLNECIERNDLITKLQCDFTTSNSITLLTSQIAFMYMADKFFSYKMILGCGIPSIKLDGTIDDWTNLKSKIRTLLEIADDKIKSWLSNLEIITNKIITSIKYPGVFVNFWKKMFYVERCGSGSQTCSKGWICHLFLYDKSYCKLGHVFDSENELYDLKGITFWDDFPNCEVKCPFMVNSESRPYYLNAGIYGFTMIDDHLRLISGFTVSKLDYDEWSFDDKPIHILKINFSQETYSRIKYNGKLIHEWYQITGVTNEDRLEYDCDNTIIYYNTVSSSIDFIYRGEGKYGPVCMYQNVKFTDGGVKVTSKGSAVLEYFIKNSTKIYEERDSTHN